MKTLIASAIIIVSGFIGVQTQAQDVQKNAKKELKTEQKTARRERRKLEAEEVSNIAKEHFYTDFGEVNGAKWERGPQFDEVTFPKDGVATTAYYDYDGRLVGTTTSKKFTDLPANAQKEIKKEYKDYTTGAVIMYDDNDANDNNLMMFGGIFEGADHYFVTVSKGKSEIVLLVTMSGEVSYFKKLS